MDKPTPGSDTTPQGDEDAQLPATAGSGAGTSAGQRPHEAFQLNAIPAADQAHPLAVTFTQAWDLYKLGDYAAARERARPLLAASDAPASLRAAAEQLSATTQIELPSLLVGVGLVAFFVILLVILY